jgi:hypothetical protein
MRQFKLLIIVLQISGLAKFLFLQHIFFFTSFPLSLNVIAKLFTGGKGREKLWQSPQFKLHSEKYDKFHIFAISLVIPTVGGILS